MRVLVGCEFSQIVTQAFRKRGHEAYSCDLIPTEGNPQWHIQGDVLDHLDDGWDLAIFHPPCTYLTNAGVRHLYNHVVSSNGKHAACYGFARWIEMRKAAEFFRQLLEADIPRIAVENPIPHRYAVAEIGRKYDQLLQPYQFGHGETKATCLWLKNLPLLEPTNIVDGRKPRVHYEPPSKDRWKNRSRTYQGIAESLCITMG